MPIARPATWAYSSMPFAAAASSPPQPASRAPATAGLVEVEDHLVADLLCQRDIRQIFGNRAMLVGDLEHAMPRIRERPADAKQLVLRGEGACHEHALGGLVQRTRVWRSPEHPHAAPQRRPRASRRSPRRWRPRPRPPCAPSPMRAPRCEDLRTHIDGERQAIEGVEVLRERGPVLDPLSSALPGMSSTPSMTPMSQVRSCSRTGAKPTPHSSRPWSHRASQRRQVGVPGHLAIVVGVHVDPTRRDQLARTVDLGAPTSLDTPTATMRSPRRHIPHKARTPVPSTINPLRRTTSYI